MVRRFGREDGEVEAGQKRRRKVSRNSFDMEQ